MIVIGDCGVGKSSLMKQFFWGSFQEDNEPTIGVDLFSKIVMMGNQEVKLQIWDTAGNEKYNTLSANFFQNSKAILIVYAVDE